MNRTEDRPLTVVDEHAHAWSPKTARTRFRNGLAGPTAGVAAGHTQVNLISVPADWAYDMLLFAQRNPRACPVLDVTGPGSPATVLAPGADLRADLPLYRVWRGGTLHRGRPAVPPAPSLPGTGPVPCPGAVPEAVRQDHREQTPTEG